MSVLNGKGVCSAIYFLNLRGDVLIHRAYRDDVGCVHACAVALVGLSSLAHPVHTRRRHMADAFRTQVLQNKDMSAAPVVTLGSCTFLHTREVCAL
jgi:hypothetical protein